MEGDAKHMKTGGRRTELQLLRQERQAACCSKKGWAAEKSSKKGVNRKEKVFPQLTNSMVLAK
jgi:hypothetical protein